MNKPDTFAPSKELRDYYQQYHQGKIEAPPTRALQPEDFDFPCSADWRAFYEQRYGGDIDFPVSATWGRHYRSIGLMPPLSKEADEPPPLPKKKPPSPREWLKIGVALAETHQRKTVKGVLR